MEKNWIKVLTSNNPIEAEMVRQMLETHDIAAVLLNKQDSSYRFGQVELYVHASDAGTARRLMAEHLDIGDV